jgi:hypothetical protein
MFLSNRMKPTQQAVLYITQHGVDPFKTRKLGALTPTTVTIELCAQSAVVTPLKHQSPSEIT